MLSVSAPGDGVVGGEVGRVVEVATGELGRTTVSGTFSEAGAGFVGTVFESIGGAAPNDGAPPRGGALPGIGAVLRVGELLAAGGTGFVGNEGAELVGG